jgi:hypothetical protein
MPTGFVQGSKQFPVPIRSGHGVLSPTKSTCYVGGSSLKASPPLRTPADRHNLAKRILDEQTSATW